MIIGIPTESQHEEQRVGLTPAGVYALVQEGHRVVIENNAGALCGFSNEDYRQAGGELVFSEGEVFQRADLVVKVHPITANEAAQLKEGSTLFSFFELGIADRQACQIMADKEVTSIGLDLIQRQDGQHPVLTAMSEIAGVMAPHVAARFLESTAGGRGILLGGIAGLPAANVVILGAGVVGGTAARSFLGAGAHVIIMDNNLDRLRRIESLSYKMISTAIASSYNIARYTRFADVLVGAIFIHSQRTPHLVYESHVKNMKKGALIIDISIDQGGCVETSRPTSHRDPVFKKHGVIHYCVPNMPAAVARTASHALNNVVLPFVQTVSREGQPAAWQSSLELQTGTYLFKGHCTNQNIAGLFKMDHYELSEILKSTDH